MATQNKTKATLNVKHTHSRRKPLQTLFAGLVALAAIGTTGCQIDVGGQTLPSPYYIYDDVQYFPAGPEFKLSREAAAMKAYSSAADE